MQLLTVLRSYRNSEAAALALGEVVATTRTVAATSRSPPPERQRGSLTRRDVRRPTVAGKVYAVIEVRQAGTAVFNLSTQFGGGKTHALTLLYHLAKGGAGAAAWTGVDKILQAFGQHSVPEAAVAVIVGTEFDAISGRGEGGGSSSGISEARPSMAR